MIVSGFTQRSYDSSEKDLNVPGQHSHCVKCRKVNCSQFVDNVTACVMVTCEACGWRCHECKQSEHVLTCQEARVPCVNKEYGCPHILKRFKMASHLPVCPASVVCCVEEWSRWPLHSRDKGVRAPVPQTKTYLDCGQLDVGLAMRDQRMLIDSLRAPQQLRRTLRNSLTQKYPAAPLTLRSSSYDSDLAASEDTSQTMSDDETDAPWDLSKPHPGLTESIRSRLFRITKETTDSLAAALNQCSDALTSSQGQLAEISESGDGKDFSDKIGEEDSMQRSMSRSLSPGACSSISDRSVNSPSKDNAPYIDGKSGNQATGNVDSQPQASDNTVTWNTERSNVSGEKMHPSPDSGDRFARTNQSVDRSVRSSISSDRFSNASTKSKSTLHDIGGTQLHKLLGYQPEEGQESEIFLHKLLAVNINYECINKYISKPCSMYTFICAQNFRRDEYKWHFKNIHQEIHQGFCGWLEQRCPLAYLGCDFSFHRMEPAQPNTTLYHSWLQESYGLRSNAQPLAKMPESADAKASLKSSSAFQNVNSPSSTDLPEESGFSKQTKNQHMQSESRGESKDEHKNCQKTDAVPSISDLAEVDKQFNNISIAHSGVGSKDLSCNHVKTSGPSNFKSQSKQDNTDKTGGGSSDTKEIEKCGDGENASKTKNYMRVKPTIYTAFNWDSKVHFQYDVEEEGNDVSGMPDWCQSLTELPFEILQQIAKHLDSFSLRNLALTSRRLRDVCCSLLDDHGIVVLNWKKQKSGIDGAVTWKVVNKKWLFSTSFEPIRWWKFTNHPTIGDHLKVCPFNKDIVEHTEPIKVMF